jgi:hypothetical protein
MKLSKEAFARAREFIQKNARPLDRSLFDYLFEKGSRGAVVEELSKFQNSDGGFGNALEPDFRLKASSPMATSVGFQYCHDIGATADNEIVTKAIQYLLTTYDHDHGFWPSTYLDVNDAPHAPWWHLEEVTPLTEERWANPSAELAGLETAAQNLGKVGLLSNEHLRESVGLYIPGSGNMSLRLS